MPKPNPEQKFIRDYSQHVLDYVKGVRSEVFPDGTCRPSPWGLDCVATMLEYLMNELSDYQESSFHPDWSILQATRDSLVEHMDQLQKAQAAIQQHLIESGYEGGPEVVQWWIDTNQPAEIRTMRKE